MRTPRTAKDNLVSAPDAASAPDRRSRGSSKRTPEFETALGARIRAARVAVKMSQGALAQAIGVSFQQVQKYELGKDRVAASTLQRVATALGVRPGSFFDDDIPVLTGSTVDARAAIRIAERIQRVHSPKILRRLLALVDVLAEAEPSGTDAEEL